MQNDGCRHRSSARNRGELLSDGLKEVHGKLECWIGDTHGNDPDKNGHVFSIRKLPNRGKAAAIRYHDEERALEILLRAGTNNARRCSSNASLVEKSGCTTAPRGTKRFYRNKLESKVWMKDIFPEGELFDPSPEPSGLFRKELKHRHEEANHKRWERREGELPPGLQPASFTHRESPRGSQPGSVWAGERGPSGFPTAGAWRIFLLLVS